MKDRAGPSADRGIGAGRPAAPSAPVAGEVTVSPWNLRARR
jgi:hypothetical protein